MDNIISYVQNLRFSQWCWWSYKSSWTSRCIAWQKTVDI